MEEILEFLKECGVFFVATVEDNHPRVRPFGFVMDYDGKLCFCTGNYKPVYRQMAANPKVEISAYSKDGKWIRLHGNAEFCTSIESKAKALEIMPSLASLYSEDDDIFEIFYLDNASATICCFQGENKTINL